MLEKLKEEGLQLNLGPPANNLVVWTGRHVSVRDQETGLVAIKPSGFKFEDLSPEQMVVVDLSGETVEGVLQASSETESHLNIYRHMPAANGVVPTHSNDATAFAALGKPISPVLTATADAFRGPIPCGDFALIGGDEIGRIVVESIGSSSACLLKNHGVFAVGPTGEKALQAAVMVEDVDETVWIALQMGVPEDIPAEDVARLYDRYTHVYGQSPSKGES
jgi:L-ribulose-5-phosphate 4-epimerase